MPLFKKKLTKCFTEIWERYQYLSTSFSWMPYVYTAWGTEGNHYRVMLLNWWVFTEYQKVQLVLIKMPSTRQGCPNPCPEVRCNSQEASTWPAENPQWTTDKPQAILWRQGELWYLWRVFWGLERLHMVPLFMEVLMNRFENHHFSL